MKTLHRLVALLAVGIAAVTPRVPRLPMVVKFAEHPFVQRGHAKIVAGGAGIRDTILTVLRAVLSFLTPARLAVAVALLALLLVPHDGGVGALLAGPAVLLTPEIQKKKADHDKILDEAFKLQEQYKGKPMPQNVGEEFQAKTQEAKTLWDEIEPHIKTAEERVEQEKANIERRTRSQALQEAGHTVVDPTMPDHRQEESKTGVAGYVTFSDFVTMSAEYQKAAEGGFRHPVQLAGIPIGLARASKSRLRGPGGEPLIALGREERKAFEQLIEGKSLVSIGSGVIEPQRLSVEPQVTADYRPRLRDLLPIGQTGSSSVSYIREESFTRAAAETTPGSAKPEAALSYTEQTATVRTIPAWIPVTTDQLADWPGLRSRIDNRLLYDISKAEAESIVYGSGVAPILEGTLTVSGTQDITADAAYVSANDVLEHIRLGAALVQTAGYEPNGVLIHPMDWFAAVVLKGTDDHYLGQVFLTADREKRVWGLTIVEDVAAQATAGVATEARNLIVADWVRGAEILDRMQSNVMVGLNSDDFTKNRRTLLAEERIAFPIYAPAAFAYKETRASAT